MGRKKKQHLTRRADGRYRCIYKGVEFYGKTEDEALNAREEYKRRETMGLLGRERPTVSEYGLKWLPVHRPAVAKSTYRGLAIHLEKLLKQIGDMYIEDVKPSDIKKVYSAQYLGLSNNYILNGRQLFCDLFDSAVSDGFCRTNPARDKNAAPHKGTKGSHRAITPQEREWITTLCKDHRCHAAAMTMLYAGVRPQEVKAMTIEGSVDFENNMIHLREFAHLDGYYHYKVTEKGKTDNAVRDIPLLSILKETLQGKSGLIVTDEKGEIVSVRAWRCLWTSYKSNMEKEINGMMKRWYRRTRAHKKILAEAEALRKEGKKEEAEKKEAEIPPWIEFNVVPYDLRHSFCVMCRDNGVELHTCIEWMGHADSKMILQIYDDVSDSRSKNEAQKLEKWIEKGQNKGQDGEVEPGSLINQGS